MAYLIKLKPFIDKRGQLTAIDKVLPFDMKRFYYIIRVPEDGVRGGHRHNLNMEAIFCLSGNFTVIINNGKTREEFYLDDQDKCLIIEPFDWHAMYKFSKHAILLGVSSMHYDPNDCYFEEPTILP